MISKSAVARATAAAAMGASFFVACADRSAVPPASLASNAATARHADPPPAVPAVGRPDAAVPIDAFYTHDVWVVAVPPLAIYLLARFDEAPASAGAPFDCERALLDHARMLGGNRLYVDRDAPCRGTAYFVRPPRQTESDAGSDVPLRSAGVRTVSSEYEASVRDWIRARWRAPEGLSEEELRNLCTVVQFSTSENLHVWNVRGQPIRSSGNAAFDASVHDAVDAAIEAHAPLPEPPAGDYGRNYRRAEIRFGFTLGNIGQCR